MKFIVKIHWDPGTPKAYPPVEAPDAQTAVKMIRESIGHSYNVRATASVFEDVARRKATYKGLCAAEDPIFKEGFKINILLQPKNVLNEDSKKRELIKTYLLMLLNELKRS